MVAVLSIFFFFFFFPEMAVIGTPVCTFNDYP